MDMYRIFSQSKIVLNIHLDFAEEHAGNMRLFEASGIGVCVITDGVKNVSNYFDLGKEMICYEGKKELLQKIKELLSDEKMCEKIAYAGQLKTLNNYTIAHMFSDLKVIFENESLQEKP